MAKDLSAPRMQEWLRWIGANTKVDKSYLAQGLLDVLNNDGPKMLSAVIAELGLGQTSKLLEEMREPSSERGAQKNTRQPPKRGEGDNALEDVPGHTSED